MVNLSAKIKANLEHEYSMPFVVERSVENDVVSYLCNPDNEGKYYFQLKAYIKHGIRLVIEITPQKFAIPLLQELADADEEKRDCFYNYINVLQENGAKVTFLVNDLPLPPKDQWPEQWLNFSCKIEKRPIPEYNGIDDEYSILSEWLEHGINLIFSLLTIKDIGVDEMTLAVLQAEGTKHDVQTVRYERNPIYRQICLMRKGYTCAVCGLNFYETYGQIGKNFIEVHHTTPVSEMGENYKFNVDKDLVPLCSNCHSMAHRKKPPFQVEELRNILEEQTYGAGVAILNESIENNADLDFIVGVVKATSVLLFKTQKAKLYYFGKRFPTKYNLLQMKYFAPYYDGGVWGYYDVKGIRTAHRYELDKFESRDENDIRIVLELGEYHQLVERKPIRLSLAMYTHALTSLQSMQKKADKLNLERG